MKETEPKVYEGEILPPESNLRLPHERERLRIIFVPIERVTTQHTRHIVYVPNPDQRNRDQGEVIAEHVAQGVIFLAEALGYGAYALYTAYRRRKAAAAPLQPQGRERR